MKSIGLRVREARQRLNFTMKQLSDITGLSTGNISDIENGKNTPSVPSLISLSRAFGCSLDWLLTGENVVVHSYERLTCDGVALSAMERDLVAMFRLLPQSTQKEVFDLVHFKYSRLADGEKESIFWTYFDGSSEAEDGPVGGSEAQDGTA